MAQVDWCVWSDISRHSQIYPPRGWVTYQIQVCAYLREFPIIQYPARGFLMPPPSSLLLRQLDRLDRSSPEFGDQLKNVLYGQEYTQCVPNFEGDDLMWFVEYLSTVRRHTPLPTLHPLKRTQVLDDLDPSGLASRKCLRELRSICGTRMILPASYTLPAHLLHINDDPFVSGGFGDVYEGTLNCSKVCIKRLRVYTVNDPKTFRKVRYKHCCLTSSPTPTKFRHSVTKL